MSDEKPSKGMILAGGVRFYELQKKRGLKNLTGFKPMPQILDGCYYQLSYEAIP